MFPSVLSEQIDFSASRSGCVASRGRRRPRRRGCPASTAPIRFGIFSLGGALESRSDREPLLAELARVTGRPMAFLPGKMAQDAVSQRRMTVIAQVTRHDGLPGCRVLLITRRAGERSSLQDLLEASEYWRLARGEARSISGYIVPQLQFFLPNQMAMETRFASEMVGTHQATALAVANGEADVATNDTADFERFTTQFPNEACRPAGDLGVQADCACANRCAQRLPARAASATAGLSRGLCAQQGGRGDAELKSPYGLAGFVAADNRSLIPAARLAYQLARAQTAQWVSHDAKQARLRRIEVDYQSQLAALKTLGP